MNYASHDLRMGEVSLSEFKPFPEARDASAAMRVAESQRQREASNLITVKIALCKHAWTADRLR